MTIRKARSRNARTAPLALYLATWEERPRTVDELNELMRQRDVAPAARGALRVAFVRGGIVFFVGAAMRFATATGIVSQDWLVSQYQTGLREGALALRGIARRFNADQMSIDEFRDEMAAEIERNAWEAALLVVGPILWGVPALIERVRQMMQRQLAWLNGMINAILLGTQKKDGTLLRRAAMYAGGGWWIMNEVMRWLALSEGHTHEENVLGVAEHCGGCVAETAKGRVPIGTLVPIGERDCLHNCRCRLVFS